MNNLIASDSENRSPEYALRLRINQDLHESLSLTLLLGTSHPPHRVLPNQSRLAQVPHLCLGHAGASQRRIDVQRIGSNAIAHLAWIIIQEIGSDYFEVVIGSMGEASPTVAIAHCPDTRNVGAQE